MKNNLKKSIDFFISEDTCGPANFSPGTNYILRGIFSDSVYVIHSEFFCFLVCSITISITITFSLLFLFFAFLHLFISIFIAFLLFIANCFMYRNNFVVQQRQIKFIFTWTGFINTFYACRAQKLWNILITTTVKLELMLKTQSDLRSRSNLK